MELGSEQQLIWSVKSGASSKNNALLSQRAAFLFRLPQKLSLYGQWNVPNRTRISDEN
ncbi:hypothetical protein LX87_01223 [Larkinella arboricola]|uniref:Uncharacterized protein n=1 Tax=Larkinella arboricola TaxID=643671 RepID=A0A327X8M5_LARAB|nr:hypothetical protein LX87_01223 [Larkinella arboricola]